MKKTIFNVRGLLACTAVILLTGIVVWSLFDGITAKKLISLGVGILLIACGFIVFPICATVTEKDITIFFIFGIKRQADWAQIENIVRTKGLYKDFFFYPIMNKGKPVKVDFPAYKRLEKIICEYWHGTIKK